MRLAVLATHANAFGSMHPVVLNVCPVRKCDSLSPSSCQKCIRPSFTMLWPSSAKAHTGIE